MYKINKNIKKTLVIFTTLLVMLISFGLLFSKSNSKNNNVNLNSQKQKIQLNSDEDSWYPGGPDPIKQIVAGHDHSALLTNSGQMYTWGKNGNGQLGDGTWIEKSWPMNITANLRGLSAGEKITQISLGEDHSAALTTDGKVFTWGRNDEGQIGKGNTSYEFRPKDISAGFSGVNGKIIQISMGGFHSAALSSSGQIYIWGKGVSGQLGFGNINNLHSPTELTIPEVSAPDYVKTISMGRLHSSAITNENKVFMWGNNYFGQLGNESEINDVLAPINITDNFPANTAIDQIALGNNHSAALSSTTNKVFTWGDNGFGQLGDETVIKKSRPEEITSKFSDLGSANIIKVSLGENFSTALSSTGQVYTWGAHHHGKLGNNQNSTPSNKPINIQTHFPSGSSLITSLVAGGHHTIALSSTSQIYSWGKNDDGQLGKGHSGNAHNASKPFLRITPLEDWTLTINEKAKNRVVFTTPSAFPENVNHIGAYVVRGEPGSEEIIASGKDTVLGFNEILPNTGKEFATDDKLKLGFTKHTNTNPMILGNTIQYTNLSPVNDNVTVSSKNIEDFTIDTTTKRVSANIIFPTDVTTITAVLQSKDSRDINNPWIDVTDSSTTLTGPTKQPFVFNTDLTETLTYKLKITIATVSGGETASTVPAYSDEILLKGDIDMTTLDASTITIDGTKVKTTVTLPTGVTTARVKLWQSDLQAGTYAESDIAHKDISTTGNVEFDFENKHRNKWFKIKVTVLTIENVYNTPDTTTKEFGAGVTIPLLAMPIVTKSNIVDFTVSGAGVATATINFPAGAAKITAVLKMKSITNPENAWIVVNSQELTPTDGSVSYTHSGLNRNTKKYMLTITVTETSVGFVGSASTADSDVFDYQKMISPNGGTNIGAIVGGVIGGLAALGLIGGISFIFIKKKKNPNFKLPSFKKK